MQTMQHRPARARVDGRIHGFPRRGRQGNQGSGMRDRLHSWFGDVGSAALVLNAVH
jgi:hypothetical protein